MLLLELYKRAQRHIYNQCVSKIIFDIFGVIDLLTFYARELLLLEVIRTPYRLLK